MRRAKIVATIGPATSSPERLAGLIAAGMDVARLNFSHGTHEEHATVIAALREEARKAARPIAILQDLQGPKIRTGRLKGGGPATLVAGARFVLTTRDVLGTSERVTVTYEPLPREVRPGDRILLSDGLIELRALRSTATEVVCEVINGQALKEGQGVNLPGVPLSAPSLTAKDRDDLAFGLAQGVDLVALSFVRSAADIVALRAEIGGAGADTPIIAKLEKPEAVADLPAILEASDGVMVARGDLGVEVPPERAPILQKEIIRAANLAGKPVITATQMLESMIVNPRPTRAEASDVANAILDGSDAVMLSGETARGAWPLEAVAMMSRIADEAGQVFDDRRRATGAFWPTHESDSTPRAIAAAVSAIVRALPVTAVWVFTESGETARQVARFRPPVPILAFTPSERTARRLSLLWGVTPILTPYFGGEVDFEAHVHAQVIGRGARPGDLVALTGGRPFGGRQPTNFLMIERIRGNEEGVPPTASR